MSKPVAIFCVTTPMSVPLFGNRFHLLVEAGIDLHVIIGEPITESIPELPTQATVHVVPMIRSINPLSDLNALLKMVKLQRRLTPKLVAAATPKASLIGLLAARINRVPVRVWEVWGAKWDGRNSIKNKGLQRLDHLIATLANTVVAVSPSLSTLLVERGIVKSKPEVIGHGSTKGIDCEIYRFAPSPSKQPEPTIGFVGRISADKGIADLIAITSSLRESLPELKLLLIGEIDSADPPSDDLMRTIDSASWIRKTGWVSNTSPHYAEIDLLLFPSIREGLPNVILEAAASEIPVVAYDAVGTRDAIVSGETGYLVPVHDRRELLRRARLVMGSPCKRREMGQRARHFVTQNFGDHRVTFLWNNFYLQLIGVQGDQQYR